MMSLWIVLVVCCITLMLVATYAIQLSKRLTEVEQQAEKEILALSHEVAAVNNAAMGVGQRLISVEKKLKLSMEKQQQMALSSIDTIPYSETYNHAASSASNGSNANELVDRYGLPEAEADLLTLLKSASK